MRTFALLAALLAPLATARAAVVVAPTPSTSRVPVVSHRGVSVGGGVHYPDMGALYFSVRPIEAFSVDALVTLASLMGGVAAHLPFPALGDIFVQVMGGFRHNAVRVGPALAEAPSGYRTFAGLGYAYDGDIEMRVVAGTAMAQRAQGGRLLFAPEVQLLLGLPL